MQAGFGMAEVNPPLGMPMEGLGQVGGCQTIHDDLFVRVLAMSDRGREVLVVGFDLLFFERPVIDRFKAALGRRCGVPPDHILLNTSHTHAGPRLTHWAYSGEPDPVYLDKIELALVRAAEQARADRRSVTVWAGKTKTDLPVSRRKPDAAGQAQWAPYRDGVICPVVPFCLFKDNAGEVVALLFSASCHPSMVYSLDISADYPGAAMRQLNAQFNTRGSLFLQGAGGDTKPRQIAEKEEYWRRGTWDEVEAAGRSVADAITRAARRLKKVTPALKTRQIMTSWPLTPPPSRAELESVQSDPDSDARRKSWAADMLRRLDVLGGLPEAVEVELHAVQIGRGLRLIGFEGELVGELGNVILAAYRQGVTFPMGYTNGAQIYLPSTRMLPEHGYEVDSFWEYHYPSPLQPVTDKVVRAALKELQRKGGIL